MQSFEVMLLLALSLPYGIRYFYNFIKSQLTCASADSG